ncbi:hypothetical protein FA13DRAFT_1845993 [Coprinellus micaceus]|uniref:Uncharacterized protein n=1 Tax=Coprinellus micaceus TaxID=71717 RepID=A0A4Y7TAX7_COPMI|nr:hypothetical protein FA13DRAFT_1845993 [Coprinellus micaceus]
MVSGQDVSALRKGYQSFECRGVRRSFPWLGGRTVRQRFRRQFRVLWNVSCLRKFIHFSCTLGDPLERCQNYKFGLGFFVGPLQRKLEGEKCFHLLQVHVGLTSPMDSPVLQTTTSIRSRSAKIAVIDGGKLKRAVDVGPSSPLSGPNPQAAMEGLFEKELRDWAITLKCYPQDTDPSICVTIEAGFIHSGISADMRFLYGLLGCWEPDSAQANTHAHRSKIVEVQGRIFATEVDALLQEVDRGGCNEGDGSKGGKVMKGRRRRLSSSSSLNMMVGTCCCPSPHQTCWKRSRKAK